MSLIEKHCQTFSVNQGLTTLEVLHTFEQLLGLQRAKGIKGDVLEIGVLHGATISFLTASLQDQERAFLIDSYQDVSQIKSIVSGFTGISMERLISFQLDSKFVGKHHAYVLSGYQPGFRFIHIDGEHSYDAVYSDIDLSYKYLAEAGLIVLDDIFNMASACCTHAMFDYLKNNPNLHCVAMGFNKAYLCESKYLGMYRKFFLHLPELLESRADLHIRLCFNSQAHERSYVTFHGVDRHEPKYQVIGKVCLSLAEVYDYLDLNI